MQPITGTGARNNCIISVEAAATTLHDPLLPKYTNLCSAFYLVSSPILLLTRRSLRFLTPPSNSVKIMLPEISMKRDSVGAGIRLNLSSYSSRGLEKNFSDRRTVGHGGSGRSMFASVVWRLVRVRPEVSSFHVFCLLRDTPFPFRPRLSAGLFPL